MSVAELQKLEPDVFSNERPTVDQMLELQKIGVVLGKEQYSLKSSRKMGHAHFFLPRHVEEVVSDDLRDTFRYSDHRFTGRVGRTGFRRWSMRIAEIFWVSSDVTTDGEQLRTNDCYRASYQFEWTDRSVVTALKTLHARQLNWDDKFYDPYANDQPSQKAYKPEFLGLIEQSERMNALDCERLIAGMVEFAEVSNSDGALVR